MKKYLYMFLVLCNIVVYSQNIKVTFIAPDKPGNLFWDKVSKYMEISAEELEIDLKILYPPVNNRFEVKKLAFEELNSNDKPDYLIYQYYAQVSEKILELAEEKKVYSFIFNNDIIQTEKDRVGNVNEKFKYWIGHIYPNDLDAGYKLAKSLIKEARNKNIKGKDGKIHIIGLSGSYDSTVSEDRNRGLEKAVAESEDVVLEQIVNTQWDYDRAYDLASKLKNRYPDINIFWGASDSIALAAIEARKKYGEIPGEDTLFGGIDWGKEGLEAIKKHELTSSLGGHFLEGVTSLLLIKDHSEGIDIEMGKFPVKTGMEIIDKDNVESYEKSLSYEEFIKIDLKKKSKFYNKDLKEFNFNLLEEIR